MDFSRVTTAIFVDGWRNYPSSAAVIAIFGCKTGVPYAALSFLLTKALQWRFPLPCLPLSPKAGRLMAKDLRDHGIATTRAARRSL
ncbi:hypothetical protein [Rhizobium rhizosphaerae]|uniref:hypothetical protein n=1 Tax=Xaviernesmea rhizosphaerae TaxID=1672749 RepID=UPI00111A35D2|nr:hypothetical protein [Xaviernesmea rhizosphaerae]